MTETGGKLADLGLAQMFALDIDVTGAATIGSIEHIDRLVLHGAKPSRASDVWALGTTLHRALTGQGVYGELPEGQPLTVIRRVLSTTPVVSDSLMPEVRSVIERCLRPDPQERYATADEVATALDRCR
jgi:serine/threonine protein kinase